MEGGQIVEGVLRGKAICRRLKIHILNFSIYLRGRKND